MVEALLRGRSIGGGPERVIRQVETSTVRKSIMEPRGSGADQRSLALWIASERPNPGDHAGG